MYSYIFFFTLILGAYGETDCDKFSYGSLCVVSPNDDLINIFHSLTTEIECQDECTQTNDCNFFTFEKFSNDHTSCFLFKSCSNYSSCSNIEGCSMAVSGPSSPSITTACCTEFEQKICPADFLMDQIANVGGEEMCQTLCRDVKHCSYWTLISDVCLLYSHCDQASPCNSCNTGPAFPDLSTCKSHRVEHTLIMGGHRSGDSYSTSIELITPNLVCTPEMPSLPVKRTSASAVVMGMKIYYCGGIWPFHTSDGSRYIRGTCHSYLLGQGSEPWIEEPSMAYGRYDFQLTTIGNTIYATGGLGQFTDTYRSVESYTVGETWKLRDDMKLIRDHYEHCAVAIGSRLFVLGGGGNTPYLEAIDTDNTAAGWTSLASMATNRQRHACLAGQTEGQPGIFLSGYYSEGVIVEFYIEATNHWIQLNSLKSGRSWHTMTMVNGQMIVAGGHSYMTSVETLNGTQWIETNNLKVGRHRHAAVSIPSGYFQCKMAHA